MPQTLHPASTVNLRPFMSFSLSSSARRQGSNASPVSERA